MAFERKTITLPSTAGELTKVDISGRSVIIEKSALYSSPSAVPVFYFDTEKSREQPIYPQGTYVSEKKFSRLWFKATTESVGDEISIVATNMCLQDDIEPVSNEGQFEYFNINADFTVTDTRERILVAEPDTNGLETQRFTPLLPALDTLNAVEIHTAQIDTHNPTGGALTTGDIFLIAGFISQIASPSNNQYWQVLEDIGGSIGAGASRVTYRVLPDAGSNPTTGTQNERGLFLIAGKKWQELTRLSRTNGLYVLMDTYSLGFEMQINLMGRIHR